VAKQGKRYEDMTTDEAIEKLFPKKAIEKVKEDLENAEESSEERQRSRGRRSTTKED
jgi:hypothetical protein